MMAKDLIAFYAAVVAGYQLTRTSSLICFEGHGG